MVVIPTARAISSGDREFQSNSLASAGKRDRQSVEGNKTSPPTHQMGIYPRSVGNIPKRLSGAFQNEEARFSSAGGDIDDWRIGQTNHRAINRASKDERVGIDEHLL